MNGMSAPVPARGPERVLDADVLHEVLGEIRHPGPLLSPGVARAAVTVFEEPRGPDKDLQPLPRLLRERPEQRANSHGA